jgi:WD40 repeat protein
VALAAEPPKEPILRIEMGMHPAVISRISVDRENRLLAMASDDKTIRLWDTGTVSTRPFRRRLCSIRSIGVK